MSSEQSWLKVVEVHDAERIRVRLSGELDLAGVPAVRDRLRTLAGRGETVVLDLDELTFIDMSGLRMVHEAADDASRDGWAFSVTSGSSAVRRLIGLVELDGRLPVDGGSP